MAGSPEQRPSLKEYFMSRKTQLETRLNDLEHKGPENSPFTPKEQKKLLNIGLRAINIDVFEEIFPLPKSKKRKKSQHK